MKFLDFALIVGKLKGLKRTGWVIHKIPNPESVAEHSFRLAVLAMVLTPKLKVDQLKAIKMALIHDIGEAEIGDIITNIGDTILPNHDEKINQERKAMQEIFSLADEDKFIRLFDEFEENKTREARLIKELDVLEMAIQALEYEKKYKLDLETFFKRSRSAILSEEIKRILQEIILLREH